jgi:hypothetical protein
MERQQYRRCTVPGWQPRFSTGGSEVYPYHVPCGGISTIRERGRAKGRFYGVCMEWKNGKLGDWVGLSTLPLFQFSILCVGMFFHSVVKTIKSFWWKTREALGFRQ